MPHPLPLCLPPGFFVLSLLLPHPRVVFPQTAADSSLQQGAFLGEFPLWWGRNHVSLLLLNLWSPPPDTWALPLVQTQQLHCSQSCRVPQVSFLAPDMVFSCTFNPNNFCIVFSWPLSYHLFTAASCLPLWFPSVCWLFVWAYLQSSFDVIHWTSCYFLSRHSGFSLFLSKHPMYFSLCGWNLSAVYPRAEGEAGWCQGAHENVHKHKVNWAEPSWPKPLRCSTDLCELCQKTVLFWKSFPWVSGKSQLSCLHVAAEDLVCQSPSRWE